MSIDGQKRCFQKTFPTRDELKKGICQNYYYNRNHKSEDDHINKYEPAIIKEITKDQFEEILDENISSKNIYLHTIYNNYNSNGIYVQMNDYLDYSDDNILKEKIPNIDNISVEEKKQYAKLFSFQDLRDYIRIDSNRLRYLHPFESKSRLEKELLDQDPRVDPQHHRHLDKLTGLAFIQNLPLNLNLLNSLGISKHKKNKKQIETEIRYLITNTNCDQLPYVFQEEWKMLQKMYFEQNSKNGNVGQKGTLSVTRILQRDLDLETDFELSLNNDEFTLSNDFKKLNLIAVPRMSQVDDIFMAMRKNQLKNYHQTESNTMTFLNLFDVVDRNFDYKDIGIDNDFITEVKKFFSTDEIKKKYDNLHYGKLYNLKSTNVFDKYNTEFINYELFIYRGTNLPIYSTDTKTSDVILVLVRKCTMNSKKRKRNALNLEEMSRKRQRTVSFSEEPPIIINDYLENQYNVELSDLSDDFSEQSSTSSSICESDNVPFEEDKDEEDKDESSYEPPSDLSDDFSEEFSSSSSLCESDWEIINQNSP